MDAFFVCWIAPNSHIFFSRHVYRLKCFLCVKIISILDHLQPSPIPPFFHLQSFQYFFLPFLRSLIFSPKFSDKNRRKIFISNHSSIFSLISLFFHFFLPNLVIKMKEKFSSPTIPPFLPLFLYSSIFSSKFWGRNGRMGEELGEHYFVISVGP